MHHENLNQFIGVCLEKPHMCILYAYAKFGSLSDYIKDKNENLSAEYKLSFLTDIATVSLLIYKPKIYESSVE